MTDAPLKPTTGQGFVPSVKPTAQADLPASAAPLLVATAGETSGPTVVPAGPLPAIHVTDQLARIEDKCARIEDKYARSEALLSRVEEKMEGAANRMGEAARQSDVAALRAEMRTLGDRTKRLPGAGALVLTAVITAVLTVVLMIAVQRLNLQNLLPPPR